MLQVFFFHFDIYVKIFTCNIEFQIGSEMKRKLHGDYIGDWFRAGESNQFVRAIDVFFVDAKVH